MCIRDRFLVDGDATEPFEDARLSGGPGPGEGVEDEAAWGLSLIHISEPTRPY